MSLTIGFALSGSFCTFENAIQQMKNLKDLGYEILPIMSFNAYSTDTRFGKAEEVINKITKICGKQVIHTISEAEPLGPKQITDIMLIAPCTGNTLAKLSYAINDTPVTMAAKSHLRQQKPLIIALATNDALSASAQNIGRMLNIKNVYFVPLNQDDPKQKPRSIVADFEKIHDTIKEALDGKQIQPIIT